MIDCSDYIQCRSCTANSFCYWCASDNLCYTGPNHPDYTGDTNPIENCALGYDYRDSDRCGRTYAYGGLSFWGVVALFSALAVFLCLFFYCICNVLCPPRRRNKQPKAPPVLEPVQSPRPLTHVNKEPAVVIPVYVYTPPGMAGRQQVANQTRPTSPIIIAQLPPQPTHFVATQMPPQSPQFFSQGGYTIAVPDANSVPAQVSAAPFVAAVPNTVATATPQASSAPVDIQTPTTGTRSDPNSHILQADLDEERRRNRARSGRVAEPAG